MRAGVLDRSRGLLGQLLDRLFTLAEQIEQLEALRVDMACPTRANWA
jgi:hypothetical protein